MNAPAILHHADAARLLGCSRRTILRRIHDGTLPAIKRGARTYLITSLDVAVFVATRNRILSASFSRGRPWSGRKVAGMEKRDFRPDVRTTSPPGDTSTIISTRKMTPAEVRRLKAHAAAAADSVEFAISGPMRARRRNPSTATIP